MFICDVSNMSKLYLQLGRTGDILSILPLLHADFRSTGIKSKLLVAREFAPVLDGCSYIDPVVFDGDYRDLEGAVTLARTLSNEVIVTSLHGTSDAVARHAYAQVGATGRVTSNFQKEAWNLAGRSHLWDLNLPLVFDRRSPERERQLLDANGFKKQNKKPVMLLAVDGGVTAPFTHAALLKDYVHSKFGKDYRVIDLPMVAKPDGRIYDLLAVMENAALLITIDSMPLHLAWAVRSLPVFALTNDRDAAGNPSLWHGAPWRPNHLWYCRYSDWPARAVEMGNAISWIKAGSYKGFQSEIVELEYQSPMRGVDIDAGELTVADGMCSRTLNGKPFVKDVVRMGMQRAIGSDSRIIFTRDGVAVNKPVELAGSGPSFAYRTQKDQHSPIADLFSAPKSFWRQILPEIPDLLLDNECPWWSEALLAIFKRHGARDASGCCEFVGGEK